MVESLLKEATLLIGFDHVNVLSCIGVVWKLGETPWVVMPYMSNGSLRALLQNNNYVMHRVVDEMPRVT